MLDPCTLRNEIAALQFIGPLAPPDRPRPARPPARGGLTGAQRKRLAAYIEAHLADELRLAALAELAGLSPYHFARAFKQSFGVPPHRYHTVRRIEHAKALLQTASHSVTEVALAVGYAETSSFSAAFRKVTGVAPSDYRRRWQSVICR
jgi:AraC family transcriptional regulator